MYSLCGIFKMKMYTGGKLVGLTKPREGETQVSYREHLRSVHTIPP